MAVILLKTYNTRLCNTNAFADPPPKLRYVICEWLLWLAQKQDPQPDLRRLEPPGIVPSLVSQEKFQRGAKEG